tara:strand:- start:9435 stop:9695 length:261 start_codon:yes stop_codon:yes gene_type:complete
MRVEVSPGPQDFNTLMQSDPEVRLKAMNTALARMLHEERAKTLYALRQLKSGDLSLDQINISEDGWQILPAVEPNHASTEEVPVAP